MIPINISWEGLLLDGGRFQVEEKLGEGGMAVVFRAFDFSEHSLVVVKVPKPAAFEDESAIRRFAQETQALVHLSHPNIVRVRHVGDRDGWPFVVLDYLNGGDLEICRQAFGGRLTLLNVSKWAPAIAEALDFIHSRGYVHRDVKPSNILFNGQGRAFLGDFGIAKSVRDNRTTKLTGTGHIVGTPEYMAPELVMGQTVDGRVDQYALGITIYECLAGSPPFVNDAPSAVLVMHSTQMPKPLDQVNPQVPPGVAQVIMQTLAKDPNQRFPSCTAMAQAFIEQVDRSKTQPAHSALVPGQPRSSSKTTRTLSPARTELHSQQQLAATVRKEFPARETFAAPAGLVPQESADDKRKAMLKVWGFAAGVVLCLMIALTLGLIYRALNPSTTEEPAAATAGRIDAGSPSQPAQLPQPIEIADLAPQTFEINEGEPWTAALKHSQGEGLRYELAGAMPEGVSIHPNTGETTWIPNENQGPQSYEWTILIKDQSGQERARQTYDVQVKEVNQPPRLMLPAKLDMKRGQKVRLPGAALDLDVPANTLTYSLGEGAPAGLRIDPQSGELSWDQTAGPLPVAASTIAIRVQDNAADPQTAEARVLLNFLSLEIAEIGKQTLNEGQTLRVPIQAQLPGRADAQFTYQLVSAPPGSQLGKDGVFLWQAPPDSAGAMHAVTVQVAKADDITLSGTIEFPIEVNSSMRVEYLDLPKLPAIDEDPETVTLIKDETLPSGLTLKLLGYEGTVSLVSAKTNSEGREVVPIYHTPAGTLNKELLDEQPLAYFRVADNQVQFEWLRFKDTQVRKYQELIREGVLEVQIPGKPSRYFALRLPETIAAQDITQLFKEPFAEHRFHRWNALPTKYSRDLRFENVNVEWNQGRFPALMVYQPKAAGCSLPAVAQALGYQQFQIVFEEQANQLIWRFATSPSVHEAYAKFDQRRNMLSSAQSNLREAQAALTRSTAAQNRAKTAAQKNAALRQMNIDQRNIARFQADIAALGPLLEQARAEYQLISGPLAHLTNSRISGSIYRMVGRLRVQVLTIQD